MTVAWISIGLLLVGLPLLGWWLARRRIWDRLRGRPDADPWGDWMRRHGLSTKDALAVARAVPRGERLSDERLREPAADWARTVLGQETVDWRRHRLMAAIVLLWATGVVAFLVFRLASGRPEDINWVGIVLYAGIGVWGIRRRRNLRRAVELNGEPGAAGG